MAIKVNLDKYVRWPVKQKAILWGAIAAVFIAIYYSVWFAPKRSQIGELERESNTLAAQIVEKKAIADNLESVKEAVTQMDKLLTQALEKLPGSEEIPKLLKTISDIAKETGLEAMLFRPGVTTPVAPEYFYASIPIEMQQNGSFYNLGRFFDRIGHLSRIVTIENITVSTIDNGRPAAPLLSASFNAVTFKFLSPEERPKPEPAKKGGAKAGKE